LGVYGEVFVGFLFGDKSAAITGLLPSYTLAMVGFVLSSSIILYHQVRNRQMLPVLGFVIAFGQVVGMSLFHRDIGEFVNVFLVTSLVMTAASLIFHIFYDRLLIISRNIIDFLGLFVSFNGKTHGDNLRILIFNWRDTKHIWAGGAELYVHEIAKRWAKRGYKVTFFCGNDGQHSRNEVVDEVRVFRRGGFYTVYFRAALYYLIHFRGKYDVVVESVNGMPFFTPLYVGVPKFLLVHHVHQGVFRTYLKWPLSLVAEIAESKLTPLFYKNTPLITVSESSKEDFINLKTVGENRIDVVTPGINHSLYWRGEKTTYPSFVYVGRLRPYKNVDVAINAFRSVLKKFPKAKFVIAGNGNALPYLKNLVEALGLKKSVRFLGKISDREKARQLAKSWVAIQPSAFEGWGITVIEANAAGTPVIASNISGLRDSVVDGRTGLLVNLENVDELARVMIDLLENPEFTAYLSNEAYEWSKNFSWQKSSDRFLKIIKRELAQKPYSISEEPAFAKEEI
jgi:glycosyltransferase involved in cell wall biosynthesis